MQIALLFGDRGTNVKNSIETQVDNLDIKTYERLNTFKNYVKQSNITFDRILMSTRFTDIEGVAALQDLKNFIYEYLPRASVVFIVDELDTTGVQTDFNNIFDLAIYTDATTKASNLGFVLDCIHLKIEEVRTLYSVHKQEDVAAIAESYADTIDSDEEVSEHQMLLTPSYIQPVINERPVTKNRRWLKQNRATLENVAALQNTFDETIKAGYTANLLEGYLTKEHYTFNLADVDPNTPLYKERAHNKEKQVIKRNKDKTNNQTKPGTTKKGYARLAEILNQQGVLTLEPFYKQQYENNPIQAENQQMNLQYTIQPPQQNMQAFVTQQPINQQEVQQPQKGFMNKLRR